MFKFLIVNADDLGISEGVNRGIVEAHQRGIVSSTSVMMNMPDTESGIHLVQQHAPQMGMGVHITLSWGAPLSPPEKVRSLVLENGTFCSTYEELWNLAPRFTPEDLEAEIRAQVERFETLVGKRPDHLNSHHGIAHWHPQAFDVLLKLAEFYEIPIRNQEWYRSDAAFTQLPETGLNADGQLVQRLRDVYAMNAKPRSPQYFQPATPFSGDTATAENLITILQNLPGGMVELVTHPGYAVGLQEAYAAPREAELHALMDPRVQEAITAQSISLITFEKLAA